MHAMGHGSGLVRRVGALAVLWGCFVDCIKMLHHAWDGVHFAALYRFGALAVPHAGDASCSIRTVCHAWDYVLYNGRGLLGGGMDGKVKGDALAGELGVDAGQDIELALNGLLVLGVEEDLEGAGAVLDADALADNLGGVDQVLQPVLVDGGEGAAAGALVLA